MEGLWAQVGNWGFPMIVAVYLLVRMEKKLDELTVAIQQLGQAIGLGALPAGHPTAKG